MKYNLHMYCSSFQWGDELIGTHNRNFVIDALPHQGGILISMKSYLHMYFTRFQCLDTYDELMGNDNRNIVIDALPHHDGILNSTKSYFHWYCSSFQCLVV